MSEPISVFDMLKVGIGPSSSHTLGPWRAAERFLQEHQHIAPIREIRHIIVHFYGSLALTGKGHGTDVAVLLGLSGQDPETIPLDRVKQLPLEIVEKKQILLGDAHPIAFNPDTDIQFHFTISLPFHANGLVFETHNAAGRQLCRETYYSIGGGFVVKEEDRPDVSKSHVLPFPIQFGDELIRHCHARESGIASVVWENEKSWRSEAQIREELWRIWLVMKTCIYEGCHTEGVLPGGLSVNRRAAKINRKLRKTDQYTNVDEWIISIRQGNYAFSQILKWIGCFAMAVNEENASFSRVVTAPTNGAAGVIPAVLFYLICFSGLETTDDDILDFLMVAGEVGSIFKKGSTISAAMGGCQAEIGVSSAMAAAALTEALGGDVDQALMAAEIAMEHHLGLTCDPIGGLVQVPCIERNSMGAVKAITAANIALESDPSKAKVSLDEVINTMWETAQDMNHKYKETSQGGLATQVSIIVPEC